MGTWSVGRGLGALVVGLLIGAASVQAQVAAPRLNAAFPSAGRPFNPAVVVWSGSSHVGLGYYPDVTVEFQAGGVPPALTLASDSGTDVQVALVGQTFALAIDANSTEVDDTVVAFAGKMGQTLSLGVGMESHSEPVTALNQDRGGPVLGAVWHADAFYVGGTYGTEKTEGTFGGVSLSGDRSVTRLGLGFLGGKDNRYHVEAYMETQATLEIRNGATLEFAEDGSANGLTLEFAMGSFLVGYEMLSRSVDRVVNLAPVNPETYDTDSSAVSIGWMPMKGFAVALSAIQSKQTTASSGDIVETTASLLGVSWLY